MMTTWTTDAAGVVEKWLAVPSHAGLYEVSNRGRVRSLDRINVNCKGVKRLLRGKQLRLAPDSEGYPQAGLFRGGVETKVRVHRIVAGVFILNVDNLPLVDHRDRDRVNNGVENLRWASFSDNRQNVRRIEALADMKRLAEGEAQ